ncbi:M56 family metallopeptidase [Hymenobacter setariae]|uniref:M56 family metallopeptidase n=1 Tax=Hymenobacter setariae TaxID=2594794 RepID=A0A558BXG0_9BACT|nr:M56 family metallopeptidase [Hymenobacter setariae]TVT41208.1 M56 family metallopeptidase [Hymenobacter setariae]
MEAALLYLLKANVVLALFAAAYYGLLRRLTFFGLNRVYLLVALVFAAVYPALPVPALLPAVALPALPITVLGATGAGSETAHLEASPFLNWQLLVLGTYALGAGLLLLRLLGQLLSLAWVRRHTQPVVVLGQPVRRLAGEGGPFSFGSDIYLSDSTLADTQHLAAALRHEQAHVRQGHTLDVLVAQIATALAWLNPAAWLLRRAVLDNLEYLADHAALQTGLDRRAYQYSLLHQQPGGVPAPALAFHFSFLTLKNRITMLNQPASTPGQLGRYLLAAPLVIALALGYTGTYAQAPATIVLDGPPAKGPIPIYYIDGKRIEPLTTAPLAGLNPDDIRSINVLKGEQAQQFDPVASKRGLIFITTRAGAATPEVIAFNNRVDSIAPIYTSEPAEVNAIAPKGLAYITKNYPSARVIAVTKYTRVSNSGVQYRVQLAEGKRPFYVFLTPQGDFLTEERH